MSYVTNYSGTFSPNFLESEVGLVVKTREIPQTMGETDGDRKIVKAGKPFPANDSTAVGIVFQDVDVTDGNKAGPVMVAGRVVAQRLTVADAAVTAMADIKFVTIPDITRT